MFSNNKTWVDKKKYLARKQEEFNERREHSTKKLKRVKISKYKDKIITDYDLWPADRVVLQRIATHMDRPTSPSTIELRLNKGEHVTNRHGDVYSLVSITQH